MKVKRLEPNQYSDTIDLSMYAFQYELSEEQKAEAVKELEKKQDICILGINEGDQLAAKVNILSLEVFVQEKKFKMGGIAGVASYPEYRRKGYVKNLLLQSLQTMKAAGQSVSFLTPFYIDFYRKFGWEMFADHQIVTLNKQDLVYPSGITGQMKRLRRNEFHKDLHTIYEQFAIRHSGMLVRSEEWWRNNVIKNWTPAIFYSEKGIPEGYILYQVKNRKMVVNEFIPLNNDARLGLWQFICQHDSMLEAIELKLSVHEQLPFLLKNPNVKREIKPYFMARIVDVESFLQEYPFDFQSQQVIKIVDQTAPWNNGFYQIDKQNTQKISAELAGHCYLEMSINTLTALLLGYLSTVDLWEIGAIQGDVSAVLSFARIIPNNQPYFPDFF